VVYTVTAEDGVTKKGYTVSLDVAAASSLKDIKTISVNGATGSISGIYITAYVPFGTDFTKITPVMALSDGATCTTKLPINFSDAVKKNENKQVVITAEDKSTKTYYLKLFESPPFASFTLSGQFGETIIDTMNKKITIDMIGPANVTNVAPSYVASNGITVSPKSGVAQNLSSPVPYTLTTSDGTALTYNFNVNVVNAPIPSADMNADNSVPTDDQLLQIAGKANIAKDSTLEVTAVGADNEAKEAYYDVVYYDHENSAVVGIDDVENANGTLKYTGKRQFKMGCLDSVGDTPTTIQGRATWSHIQVNYETLPDESREATLSFNPVGYDQNSFFYMLNGKIATGSDGTFATEYLWNRGHLVGYQFCGTNDCAYNLVPETRYLNAGDIRGNVMNANNDATMLYYEMQLRSWVNLTAVGKANQGLWLDYKVTPLYSGDELLPRKVRLDYVGVKADGSLVTIDLGTSFDKVGENGVTYVVLDNTSANASVNYLTGGALGTVVP
jgi:hypothetical protein